MSAPQDTQPLLGATPAASESASEDDVELSWGKLGTVLFSFLLLGIANSSVGVMIPYLEGHFELSDFAVSTLFLASSGGYCIAASSSHTIHSRFGRRGMAFIAPSCQLLFAITSAFAPNFTVFLAAAVIGGFGGGLIDGSCLAWIGDMPNANTLSGLLHGSFSLGAVLGPLIAGSMLSTMQLKWNSWYYVLSLGFATEGICVMIAFYSHTASMYCHSKPLGRMSEARENRSIFKYPLLWVFACYCVLYNGSECTVSNWLVSFMTRVRGANIYLSGLCSSAFWTGMALGRIGLGFVTDRFGLQLAVTIYLLSAVVCASLFTFTTSTQTSMALISLLGCAFGPLYPSCIVQVIKSLPKDLHVRGVSLMAASGQIGGSLLPFLLGSITQWFGLQMFQYLLLAQICGTLGTWLISLRFKIPRATRPQLLAS